MLILADRLLFLRRPSEYLSYWVTVIGASDTGNRFVISEKLVCVLESQMCIYRVSQRGIRWK